MGISLARIRILAALHWMYKLYIEDRECNGWVSCWSPVGKVHGKGILFCYSDLVEQISIPFQTGERE